MDTNRGFRIMVHQYKLNSQQNPQHVLFSETDKQSSRTTSFPYFRRPIKNLEHLTHLELSITAFLHRGKELNLFINLPCHGKNANHSLTLRMHDLVQYSESHNGIPQFLQSMKLFVLSGNHQQNNQSLDFLFV